MSDEALIERALNGESSAFETLVMRHQQRVFATARQFFRQPETVEDIAQETFTKAYFALASYQRGASFKHWLTKIAVNNCYDELRRRKARGEHTVSDLSEEEVNWLEGKLARRSLALHARSNDRSTATEIAEKILTGLSPEERVILTLLYGDEYSVAEIAQLLNWSKPKVKIRAFRARHAARTAIQRLKLTEERMQRCAVGVSVA